MAQFMSLINSNHKDHARDNLTGLMAIGGSHFYSIFNRCSLRLPVPILLPAGPVAWFSQAGCQGCRCQSILAVEAGHGSKPMVVGDPDCPVGVFFDGG